ncbi:hypothetical protein HYDPIDRAFT_100539, partial [Hydnomerulius pinastri MD-312]
LVHFGFFPTVPSQPRMAVSIELLAFYCALFEQSCDAINTLTSALHTHYVWRGFRVVNKTVQDPFRCGLGFAVQWYDVLQVQVEYKLETAIQACRDRIKSFKIPSASPHHPMPHTPDQQSFTPNPQRLVTPSHPAPPFPLPASDAGSNHSLQLTSSLTPGSCAPILVQRCPACFGGTTFGQSLSIDGGDIHVATDGNFHHHHRRSAGDSPSFYEPAYFLPKGQIDAVGAHIDKQRKKPLKAHKGPILDEAIDSCESSYEAADGKKQKTSMDSFDDTGLMVLICCHDIPLFFANIDSPGEQQKYSVALITHLFSLLPPRATVAVLYDIRCVLARTLSLYDILPGPVVQRLHFATTAMHAYGHKWACQLVFNPRLAVGMGLSNGEGTERLWSRLIKLIGIEHSSSVRSTAVGSEMLRDLGDWIKRRLQRGVREQGKSAQDQIENCGVHVEELVRQWASQRESQLSV